MSKREGTFGVDAEGREMTYTAWLQKDGRWSVSVGSDALWCNWPALVDAGKLVAKNTKIPGMGVHTDFYLA
jgi:hypothetical protein